MDDSSENWFDADVATFGDRLAAAREAAGMSQEDLAKRLGVKLATLRKWEDDWAEPRANRLSMIAGLLGVSMSWLITGVGEGVDGPEQPVAGDNAREILNELRELRTELTAKAEHVGRIEKRLRQMVQEDQFG